MPAQISLCWHFLCLCKAFLKPIADFLAYSGQFPLCDRISGHDPFKALFGQELLGTLPFRSGFLSFLIILRFFVVGISHHFFSMPAIKKIAYHGEQGASCHNKNDGNNGLIHNSIFSSKTLRRTEMLCFVSGDKPYKQFSACSRFKTIVTWF